MAMDSGERSAGNRAPWRLFDGSIAVSFSMMLAVLLKLWENAVRWPLVGQLHEMTQWEDGVLIVATLLLFPTAIALYGGTAMIFAAKETVDAWARKRDLKRREEGRQAGLQEGRIEGLQEGRQEGRQEERERIAKVLAEQGAPLTDEQIDILAAESRRP